MSVQSAIEALRYLAQNPRPNGGEDQFNSAHLLMLADELQPLAAKKIARAMEDCGPSRLQGRLKRAVEVLKSAPCDCHRRSDGWPCGRCVRLHELQEEIR
jgi:hypothetical protein